MRYKVFDIHLGYWLPGDYSAAELRKRIGIDTNFSKYANSGCALNRRYRIEFQDGSVLSEGKKTLPLEMLAEWDRVRLSILGRCKR